MDANSVYNRILNIFESNEKPLESVMLKPNKTNHTVNIENNAAIRITLNGKSKYIEVKLKYEKLLINPIIPKSTKSQKD